MNIAIVGAGLMGRTLAWQLLLDTQNTNQKMTLTLFDKDPIEKGGAAAYTAAGMIAPYSEVEKGDPEVFEMGVRSCSMWPQLVAALNEDVDFSQYGTLVIAHKNDRSDFQRYSHQLYKKLGDKAEGRIEHLTEDKLKAHCPELVPQFKEALFLKEEAFVDPEKFMAALAKQLTEAGITWHAETEVQSISTTEENGVTQSAVTSETGTQLFDWVIDCRGMGAKADIHDLRGVRGEIITLHAPEVQLTHQIRLTHPRYCIYIVPRKNHRFVIGATQIETEDDSPISLRSTLELLSAAYSVHSGFAEARILTTETNCRPALKDNVPRIQVEGKTMRINGLFRHGYLTAPYFAQQASHIIFANNEHATQHPTEAVSEI